MTMEALKDMEPLAELFNGDRRLTIILMGYWQGIRLDDERCARAKLFHALLPDDLAQDCCTVVPGLGGNWQLRQIGEQIARHSGISGPMAALADLPPGSLLAEATRDLDDAFNFAAPVIHEGETCDGEGAPALFRSILLPLSDERGRVTQLLAAARCSSNMERV